MLPLFMPTYNFSLLEYYKQFDRYPEYFSWSNSEWKNCKILTIPIQQWGRKYQTSNQLLGFTYNGEGLEHNFFLSFIDICSLLVRTKL